ncbi:hypothetical protein DFJ73DRAFT_849320 [Zopfochytrium polystomum]|nr:hypothetical protein DFJ73DRAFT_849320 [Zopfochytrium polystomum]
MKKRKSITAVSPSTPKEFRKIFPLDPSTESSPPAPDDRRPSQSTAAVIDAAQLSNESALRAKCDSLDIQLAELLSMIDERTAALDRALRGDAATEDLSSWARKRIREANDAISRLPPQALLAPEIVLVDDSSSLYGEITSAVQESVRFYRTASVELAKYKEVLVGSLEVDSDDFNSRSVQMSVLEHLLAKLGDLLDGTKRLRAFDEQCADLLTWVLSAKVAAEDILQRQNSEDSSEDRSEEVDLLEGKIRDFDETMETFLASSSSLSASFPEDEKRFATAVSAKRSVVNEQWIGLQTTLSTLRGSSSERLRRVEFEKAAASVDSLLNGISSRLATHVTSDISSLSVFSELEIELDTIVAPRLGELREMAAVGAHTDFERERYMSRYRLLSEEFRKLGGWLGRERSEKDRSLVVRSVQRELDDILRMQAEFAKISQEAAVSITSPRPNTDPPRLPNLSELEQVLNMLESRYSWYNGEITSLLTNLEPKCQELGMQDKHAGLVKKWSSMKLMKERIAAEGKRRVASKKLAAKSTKTFIPRIASGSTRLGSTPELKPPTSYHQKRAASPSSTRSLSPLPSSFSSTGRLSPLNGSPAAARFTPKSVKVFLPSPNHYVPNPNDPLDVEVASVVNSCPMSIKVVPAGEGKGYWFGDLMPKLCFCRVVREGIVMVRVGGGWQDLRSYLQEHSMLEARLPTVRSFAPSVDEPGADDGSLDAARELNASSLALPSSSSSSSSSSSTSPSGSSSSASTPEKSPAYIVVDTDEVSNPYNLAFHRAMGTWAAKR